MNSRGVVLIESILSLVLVTIVLALFLAANAALERRKDAIESERNRAIVRLRARE